jgi:predicted nucleic-acid-binding protein
MRAIDTNVLVRLITRDDRKQVERAEAFVATGAWISQLVLAETLWVLESIYALRRNEIAESIEMLLNHTQFTLQDGDVVAAALDDFRKSSRISFPDALILALARKNGRLPLGSFDGALARLDDVQLL